MFSGQNLADEVLTWAWIHFPQKIKGNICLQWCFEQCIVKLVSWSGKLQYIQVQALRVSSAQPVTVSTEESQLFSPWKRPFYQLSWIRSGEKKEPQCLQGWRSLSPLEQLLAQGYELRFTVLPPLMRACGRARAQPFVEKIWCFLILCVICRHPSSIHTLCVHRMSGKITIPIPPSVVFSLPDCQSKSDICWSSLRFPVQDTMWVVACFQTDHHTRK